MRLNDAALARVGGYSGYTERDYQELYDRRNDKTEDPSQAMGNHTKPER